MRVQETGYKNRIMLIKRAKICEIVKIFNTIEECFETGKISYVAVFPRSSRLLKKKREDIVVVSYEGGRPREDHCPPKVGLDLP